MFIFSGIWIYNKSADVMSFFSPLYMKGESVSSHFYGFLHLKEFIWEIIDLHLMSINRFGKSMIGWV